MPDLSISRFQRTTATALDGARLRLDSTGELSTGKRSWLGRLVRFIAGPTKGDIAANKQIQGGLLRELKSKYGDAVGTKAFLAGNTSARLNDSGRVVVDLARPLTARQVRDAITYARIKGTKHALREATLRADRFSPGLKGFDRLLHAKGLKADDLGAAQKKYFMSRLRDDVAARTVRDERQPDTDTIRKLAGRLLDHTVALGEKAASRADRAYKSVDRLCADMAMALAGPNAERPDKLPRSSGRDGEGLGALLGALALSGDGLIEDLMRGELGVPGGDDMQRPLSEAAQRTFAALSRSEARGLLDSALAPDGPARKLAFLLELATADKGVKEDGYQMAAVANLARASMVVLGALAARAELPDLADQLDHQMGEAGKALKVPLGGTKVAALEVPGKALEAAGIGDTTDMKAMLGEVMEAIKSRAETLHQAEERQQRELDEQMSSSL